MQYYFAADTKLQVPHLLNLLVLVATGMLQVPDILDCLRMFWRQSEKTIKTRKLTGNPVLPDFCCLCVLIMKNTVRQMITITQISTNTITLAEIPKNEMNVKFILFNNVWYY